MIFAINVINASKILLYNFDTRGVMGRPKNVCKVSFTNYRRQCTRNQCSNIYIQQLNFASLKLLRSSLVKCGDGSGLFSEICVPFTVEFARFRPLQGRRRRDATVTRLSIKAAPRGEAEAAVMAAAKPRRDGANSRKTGCGHQLQRPWRTEVTKTT